MITIRLSEEELNIITIALDLININFAAFRHLDNKKEIATLTDKLNALCSSKSAPKLPDNFDELGILEKYEQQLKRLDQKGLI